jgi:hypothetical protein
MQAAPVHTDGFKNLAKMGMFGVFLMLVGVIAGIRYLGKGQGMEIPNREMVILLLKGMGVLLVLAWGFLAWWTASDSVRDLVRECAVQFVKSLLPTWDGEGFKREHGIAE